MKSVLTVISAVAIFLLTINRLVQAAGVDMTNCKVLYHFNNQAEYGESGTYIHDFSESGHYGSVPAGKTAGYVTNGAFDGGIEFDGTGASDHRIFIHNGMTDFWNNAGQWSVAMWINISTTSSSQNIIGAVNPTTGAGNCTPWIWYGAGGYGGRIQLASWYHSCPGSAYDPSVSSDANILNLNQWTHIAITRDGKNINFYKNGDPWGGFSAVSSQNSSLGGGNTDLQIGACGSGGARLRGIIDELVIFSRTLSSDEVNDLFVLGEISMAVPCRVIALPATDVGQTNATLWGKIKDDGGDSCQWRFDWWSTDMFASCGMGGALTTGQSFHLDIDDLTPDTEYHFQAFARNSEGESKGNIQSFTTLPGCEGTILLLTPNGGEELVAGSTYEIIWETTDTIENVLIEYSANNGEYWTAVDTVSNTDLYEWLVPQENSQQCLVRISGAACPHVNDTSDDVFTIYQCTLAYDLNHDCIVDMLDFVLLVTEWSQCGNPFDPNCQQ